MINDEFYGALLGTILVGALVVFGIVAFSKMSEKQLHISQQACGYLDNVRYCIEDGKVLRMEK